MNMGDDNIKNQGSIRERWIYSETEIRGIGKGKGKEKVEEKVIDNNIQQANWRHEGFIQKLVTLFYSTQMLIENSKTKHGLNNVKEFGSTTTTIIIITIIFYLFHHYYKPLA